MAEKTASDLHDDVNVAVLTFIFIVSVVSLYQGEGNNVGHTAVIVMMVAYLLFDVAWIALMPQIAKTPVSVIIHHLVTIIVIAGAVEHAQHRENASRALLVEFNTVLLTLRRKLGRPLWCEVCFYTTWVLFRLVWFPMLGAALLASTFGFTDRLKNVVGDSIFFVRVESPPIEAYASLSFGVIVLLQWYWTFSLLVSTLKGVKTKSNAKAKKTDGDADVVKKDAPRNKSLLLPTILATIPTMLLLVTALHRSRAE